MAPQANAITPSPADPSNVPAHIAIIMDGNSRWAREKSFTRLRGHTEGAEALRQIIETCGSNPHIRHLTLYAFSTENWKRPIEEINDLMNLLRHYVKREARSLHEAGVKMRFIGDLASLSPDIQKDLHEVEKLTANNQKLTVVMAVSYGSRQEITHAIRNIADRIAAGELNPDEVNEELVTSLLYTNDLPEPDLLIRTGGDQRLSNFLLWQSAYTELYFTDVLWPDFSAEHLQKAIDCYSQRERRYGARKA